MHCVLNVTKRVSQYRCMGAFTNASVSATQQTVQISCPQSLWAMQL